ncbi:MAG TPA: hypothetical protein VMM76_02165 [Pirellulaceae bacterium]|nr:hypothetical protein [Pirellulaceae bacterium]
MATEISTAQRDSISALIQGLRVDQLAMIEAAGKMRYTDIASTYYRLAGNRERCVKDLAAFSSDTESGKDSHFVKQMRELVANMHEALKDDEPYAVLGATVRTKDAVLDQYKRAISCAAETLVLKLLRRQYAELREARATIVEMRDRHLPDDLHIVSPPAIRTPHDEDTPKRSISNEHPDTSRGARNFISDCWYSLGGGTYHTS